MILFRAFQTPAVYKVHENVIVSSLLRGHSLCPNRCTLFTVKMLWEFLIFKQTPGSGPFKKFKSSPPKKNKNTLKFTYGYYSHCSRQRTLRLFLYG